MSETPKGWTKIVIEGCDDHTDIEFIASQDQLEFLRFLSRKSYEVSDCYCQPVLIVVGDPALERVERE